MAAAKKSARSNSSKSPATKKKASPSPEKVVPLKSKPAKNFVSASTGEVKKMQHKALEINHENNKQFAQSADSAGKFLQAMTELTQENAQTYLECNNMAASFARDFSSEALDTINRSFTESAELSKDLFSCRTLSDMFELQSRTVEQSVEGLFKQSSRLSNMCFEYGSQAMRYRFIFSSF